MSPSWARSLRDQCAEAQVPFHFKQWGAVLARARPVYFAAASSLSVKV
jgi:protein gp37